MASGGISLTHSAGAVLIAVSTSRKAGAQLVLILPHEFAPVSPWIWCLVSLLNFRCYSTWSLPCMFLMKVTEHCVTVAAPPVFFPGLDSPPFLPFGGILLDPKSLCPHHLSIHIDLKHKYGEVHNSYEDLICWTLEESEGCECCEEHINEYSVKGNVLI